MRRFPLVLAVALLAAPSRAAAQTPVVPPPVVVTEGEAVVKRAPDRAWLSIATETRESRAAEARRRSAEGMAAVQSALRATGLAVDAIRTTSFTLTPEMEWVNGRSTMRGYIVRNQVEVRIDDLDKLGEVIDAANSSRSTTITVTGPRFGLKDEASAENEALRMAVADAMARAQAMASGAKRTLGTVLRIEEHGGGGPTPEPVMLRMAAQADGPQTPIAPGEIEVRARVTMTVELR